MFPDDRCFLNSNHRSSIIKEIVSSYLKEASFPLLSLPRDRDSTHENFFIMLKS